MSDVLSVNDEELLEGLLREKRVYKEGEPGQKIHIWLYASDIKWIDAHIEKMNRSKFIRICVRKMIRRMQSEAQDEEEGR